MTGTISLRSVTTALFITIGNHKRMEVIRDEMELLKLQNVTFQKDIILSDGPVRYEVYGTQW